jgi:hypothetical protein
MGLLRRPTPVGIVEGRRLGRTCGPVRIRVHLKNQVAATSPIPHSTAISSSSIVGAGPVRMLTARQRGASATGTTPQPCDPTPPAWQAPTRVMPATARVLGSSRQQACAPTRPYHPIRVRTAHPGWAHAGCQPRWLGEVAPVHDRGPSRVPVTALIGAPTNNGSGHEQHRRERPRHPTLPRRCAAGGAGRPSPTDWSHELARE